MIGTTVRRYPFRSCEGCCLKLKVGRRHGARQDCFWESIQSALAKQAFVVLIVRLIILQLTR